MRNQSSQCTISFWFILQDRPDEAGELLRSITQANPASARWRIELAEYLLQRKQAAAAREILHLELSPEDTREQFEQFFDHRLRLGAVALSSDVEESREDQNDPVAEAPKNKEADIGGEVDVSITLSPMRAAVKSVIASPWDSKNWDALAYVRSEQA